MQDMTADTVTGEEPAALEMAPEEFRALGHHLVDRIAEFLDSVATRQCPTAPDLTPQGCARGCPKGACR